MDGLAVSRAPYAWHGTVEQLLRSAKETVLLALTEHHVACMNLPADEGQVRAWSNCLDVLQRELATLCARDPDSTKWDAIFEYELPRERGRRPDVVLLAEGVVLVLEFKDAHAATQAHIDQAQAYALDLAEYHSASHGRPVEALLVLTRSTAPSSDRAGVWITSPVGLAATLDTLVGMRVAEPIDAGSWLFAEYAPLPSLIVAARAIFQHQPLPAIRRAQSAGIPDALTALTEIASAARERGELHLALITGVPGAGKTLAGLQFVYTNPEDLTTAFLSGNGPLVEVLQHALGGARVGKVFVRDVHAFLKDYGGGTIRLPREHIWVYDEAQRAWDETKVKGKRPDGASEPEDFLRLGSRMDSWAMLVGLVGEGQEIYLGEEAGLEQWNEAIVASRARWHIHAANRVLPQFGAAVTQHPDERLDLSISLRSKQAEDVPRWVQHVLAGDFEAAKNLASSLTKAGFQTYITHNLDAAKQYVRTRYDGEVDKRFGLFGSSAGAEVLKRNGIDVEWGARIRLKIGPWFNDPPESPLSCCQLNRAASEFECQGLELDFPIVGWANDFAWNGSEWRVPRRMHKNAKSPHQLRLNSYRVLLTRGRDGFVIFVPDDTELSETYHALESAGLRHLD